MAIETTREPRRRMFFALWPDAATMARLVRATQGAVRLSGGRPTPKDQLHLTVAFLGGLTQPQLELARAVPPGVGGRFKLELDTLGFWQQSKVLWLAPRVVPPALYDLEQGLWQALAPLGFEREPRLYRPHLTLARRARPVAATVPAVHWPIEDLALVESLPERLSVRYTVLQRWPL